MLVYNFLPSYKKRHKKYHCKAYKTNTLFMDILYETMKMKITVHNTG